MMDGNFALKFISLGRMILSNQPANTMNEFKFACSHCGQHLQCDEQFSGREIQCPSCHHLIRVPPVPGKTAQYTPESGQTWATFIPPGNALPAGNPVDPPKKPNPPAQ